MDYFDRSFSIIYDHCRSKGNHSLDRMMVKKEPPKCTNDVDGLRLGMVQESLYPHGCWNDYRQEWPCYLSLHFTLCCNFRKMFYVLKKKGLGQKRDYSMCRWPEKPRLCWWEWEMARLPWKTAWQSCRRCKVRVALHVRTSTPVCMPMRKEDRSTQKPGCERIF